MKIYTKTGDNGTTSLVGGKRVSKDDIRLEAYGTADELNSFIGLLRAKNNYPEADSYLHFIQNKLFNLGAILASENPTQELGETLLLQPEHITQLEQWIDQMQATLPPLHSFTLPAGSETIALCHVCRTITRRLEREMVRLNKLTEISHITMQFVNRLSDFFYILSRKVQLFDNTEPFLWEK